MILPQARDALQIFARLENLNQTERGTHSTLYIPQFRLDTSLRHDTYNKQYSIFSMRAKVYVDFDSLLYFEARYLNEAFRT